MTYKEFATLSVDKIYAELHSSASGLSAVIAAERLAKGVNIIGRKSLSGAVILWRQMRSPMVLVLLAAFFVALFTGDISSSITILAFTLVNTGLGFAQEYRSEHIIDKLNAFISAPVTVRRDHKWLHIAREQVVVGDVIALEPGDAFPADARIIFEQNVLVDESVLTGESAPVHKQVAPMVNAPGTPADAETIGFAGTHVVSGSCRAMVFGTGMNTVLGVIAKETSEVKRLSIFEQNVSSFSRFLVKVVAITLTAVFVANLIIKGHAANPIELLLFSLALAVSVIPEALPAIITITFSKGALILAKKKVVVKRLSAIEDLGHIEILCTDKTGTITENHLTVGRISSKDANHCLLSALFSSEERVDLARAGSSFDAAIWQFASDSQRQVASSVVSRAIIPFDPKRRRNAAVVEYGGSRLLVVKGAPEDILDLCKIGGVDREIILNEFRSMGQEGMRVLAVADRPVPEKETYEPKDEENCTFVGLIGFFDPLKTTAKDAIALAEQLHLRVKIITGDSQDVAVAVGKQVGIIDSEEGMIDGPTLEALGDEKFTEAVEKFDVFARITPELKYRIVAELEKRHATGFLGEGINDAPALKEANVALVVPGASEVAREAADVVLLERSLDVIIDGIKEGRIIYANVFKYIRYTLVSNFGYFYSIALISLFIDFLPLTPAQILLINLMTDFPLIAAATDRVDTSEIAAPRRFSIRDIALFTTMLGLVSSVFDFVFFGVFRHASIGTLQTTWFFLSVVSEVVIIFALRTNRPITKASRPSWALLLLAIFTIGVAYALPYTTFGQEQFGFVRPSHGDHLAVFAIVGAYLICTELAKLAYQRFWGKVSLAPSQT